MYKLLIVDDEPLVQMGIASMIHNSNLGVELCGTASNGAEALERIRELAPEIVICDIRMPVMDGLELAETCRSIYGSLPVFILLTAYEEFELAKKAIHCQVSDYLVKLELTPDSLTAALKKAAQQISEHSRKTCAPTLHTFHDKFFLRLLNDLLTPEAIARHSQELSINLGYSYFIAASIHLLNSETPERLSEDQVLSLHSASVRMMKEILKKYAPCDLVSLDTQHISAIFYFNQESEAYPTVREGLEDAVSLLKSYFSIRVTAGVGTTARSPSDIHVSFQEARDAETFCCPSAPLIFYRDLLEQNRALEKGRTVLEIKNYIDAHLTQRLSLNAVADTFYLSPGYLSTIFKKQCGVSFNEYVNLRKVELAKELLLKQELKIYEIAAFLGFENTYYFSKVFKKFSGMSPSEFIAAKLS